MSTENQDQQHPRDKGDREIIERLLQVECSDYYACELARLRIRYRGFPGARDMQKNLDTILFRWNMTEEKLFELTRKFYSSGQVYKSGGDSQGQDDWN
jgi:hypothetical protein